MASWSCLEVLACVATVSSLLTLVFARSVFTLLRRRLRAPAAWPGISVLKPLKGVDEGLLENLRSLGEQDYPTFEIIFGTADRHDPARAVVEKFIADYPHLNIKTMWGHSAFGLNPKVANLAHMVRFAAHDVYLISDANVRLQPHAMRTLASDLQPNIGLVCNILGGVGAKSLGALAECLHLNSFVATSMSGARVFGAHTVVVGKSMLLRRHVLDKVGGWQGVRDILAEDYVLGRRIEAAGLGVAVSPYIVHTIDAHRTVREFVARHVRWAQMRRHLSPMYWTECLLNPVPFWCMTAAGAMAQDNEMLLGCALLAIFVKGVSDIALFRFLTGERMPLKALLCVIPKDCLVSAIWLVGVFRRTVTWRGNRARIGAGSTLTVCPPLDARVHAPIVP